MNVQYINPFIQASKSVLGTVLGTEVGIDRPTIAPIQCSEGSRIILIGITGEIKGQVFLGFKHDVSCKIVSSMIGFPVTEIDELAESALSELCNMILGNAATVFSKTAMRIDITPPTIVRGSNISFDTKEVEHIMIPIRVAPEQIVDMHVAIKKT